MEKQDLGCCNPGSSLDAKSIDAEGPIRRVGKILHDYKEPSKRLVVYNRSTVIQSVTLALIVSSVCFCIYQEPSSSIIAGSIHVIRSKLCKPASDVGHTIKQCDVKEAVAKVIIHALLDL